MTRADLAWMDHAACARPVHRGLPWLADPDTVTVGATTGMARVCRCCPVAAACAAHVSAERVCGGFWAGSNRADSEPAVQLTLNLGHLGRAG